MSQQFFYLCPECNAMENSMWCVSCRKLIWTGAIEMTAEFKAVIVQELSKLGFEADIPKDSNFLFIQGVNEDGDGIELKVIELQQINTLDSLSGFLKDLIEGRYD